MADTMTLIEKTVFLNSLEMLSGVPTEALAQLAARAAEIQAAPGEAVNPEGGETGAMLIVIEGQLEVRRDDGVTMMLGPLDTYGEFFLENPGQPFTVTAREEARVLAIQQEDILEVGLEYPDFGLAVLRVHARRVQQLTERVMELEARLEQLAEAARRAGVSLPGTEPAGDSKA